MAVQNSARQLWGQANHRLFSFAFTSFANRTVTCQTLAHHASSVCHAQLSLSLPTDPQESQLQAVTSREAAQQNKVKNLEQQLEQSRKELEDFVTRVGAADDRMKAVKDEVGDATTHLVGTLQEIDKIEG